MKNVGLNKVLFVTLVAFIDIFFTFLAVYTADLLVNSISVSILGLSILFVRECNG
jgi:hypothetical protein